MFTRLTVVIILQDIQILNHYVVHVKLIQCHTSIISKFLKTLLRDFPGGPMVKNPPSNAGDAGSSPGQGPKIPHPSWPKNQSIKQKQYCNKFNKDFKNGPHQKNLKKTNNKNQMNYSKKCQVGSDQLSFLYRSVLI